MYPWQKFILGLCEHLAWPILVGGCIVYYSDDIRKILARIKTLPLGTELNSEDIKEQQEAKKDFEDDFIEALQKQQKAKENFEVITKTDAKKENTNNE